MGNFDRPLETWNARYDREDFLFGEEPNAFLHAQAHPLLAGQSVLCVADGEGRNSVWLAERGLKVTAFDFAPNAAVKARRLAEQRKVHIDYRLGDILHWDWTANMFDAVVAVFIQFLSPDQRVPVFAGMKQTLKPGGLLLLEGYRPEQLEYRTGGPPLRENMYTRNWLESQFADWEILSLSEYDAVIREGAGHSGLSALIDLIARKPRASK